MLQSDMAKGAGSPHPVTCGAQFCGGDRRKLIGQVDTLSARSILCLPFLLPSPGVSFNCGFFLLLSQELTVCCGPDSSQVSPKLLLVPLGRATGSQLGTNARLLAVAGPRWAFLDPLSCWRTEESMLAQKQSLKQKVASRST